MEVRDVKKVSLVLITGDRGLCGGYNSQVIKAATKRAAKLQSQGIEVSTMIVHYSYNFLNFIVLTSIQYCLTDSAGSSRTKGRAMV